MKIDSGSNGKDKQANATREQTPSFNFSINHSSINDDIYYADDTVASEAAINPVPGINK